jgi:predicted amidohydrolase YtcJ
MKRKRLQDEISVDLLIRAGAIYSMSFDRAVYRSIAIHDNHIVALSAGADGLDKLIGPTTRIVEDSSLTLFPAFIDTHNHLLEATRNRMLVPVQQARSLSEILELIRQRANETPKGRWIQTSNAWPEQNLEEKRLPTALELDQATSDHPVLVRRGGHMAVANSFALKLASLSSATPDPPWRTARAISGWES